MACCLLSQILDADIPEADNRAVTQKADMARFSLQAGMIPAIHGAVPGGLGKVAVYNHLAVQNYLYPVPFYDYFLLVPLPDRLQKPALFGDDPIHGAVILIGLQVFIDKI